VRSIPKFDNVIVRTAEPSLSDTTGDISAKPKARNGCQQQKQPTTTPTLAMHLSRLVWKK
jgi:hypothetical protein